MTAPLSSSPAPSRGQADKPRPTNGRENAKLMYFFVGAAVLVLLIVLGFNFLGPEGASRTGIGDGPAQSPAGSTTGGPSPAPNAGAGTGIAENSTVPAPGANTAGNGVQSTVPQRPDSPTPAGRESVGAPVGAVPQAVQESSAGTNTNRTPGAPNDASLGTGPLTPAVQPASR